MIVFNDTGTIWRGKHQQDFPVGVACVTRGGIWLCVIIVVQLPWIPVPTFSGLPFKWDQPPHWLPFTWLQYPHSLDYLSSGTNPHINCLLLGSSTHILWATFQVGPTPTLTAFYLGPVPTFSGLPFKWNQPPHWLPFTWLQYPHSLDYLSRGPAPTHIMCLYSLRSPLEGTVDMHSCIWYVDVMSSDDTELPSDEGLPMLSCILDDPHSPRLPNWMAYSKIHSNKMKKWKSSRERNFPENWFDVDVNVRKNAEWIDLWGCVTSTQRDEVLAFVAGRRTTPVNIWASLLSKHRCPSAKDG